MAGCVAKLIKEHGDDLSLPELAAVLANRCPKADAIDLAQRCFVLFRKRRLRGTLRAG